MSEPSGQISSGIDALMEKYMAVSNNIANASTSGFKRTVSSFSSTLDSVLANQGKTRGHFLGNQPAGFAEMKAVGDDRKAHQQADKQVGNMHGEGDAT